MKTETKVLTLILVFSAIMLFAAVFFLSRSTIPQKTADSNQVYDINYTKGQKIGSESAKLKLVEFSDFQCPACRAAEPFVKKIRDEKSDQVQVIYRHFPLAQHAHAREAANFAEYAATEGKFWQLHDRLFETQSAWEKLPDVTEYFIEIGKEFGLDGQKIKDSIQKSVYNQKINEDISEGSLINVNATPTFYLNGKKLNIENFSEINNLIDQELK